eukprot:g20045.t1
MSFTLPDHDEHQLNQSMVKDLEFIQQHHHKFYSTLEIEQADEHQAVFWLASKRQPDRKLRITLSAATAYLVLDDPFCPPGTAALTNRQFESFEQVLSALDEGGFGDLLCNLVMDKLVEEGVTVEPEEQELAGGDERFYNRDRSDLGADLGGMGIAGNVFGGVIDDVDPMAD